MVAKTVEELTAELEALKARLARSAAQADDDDPGERGTIPASRFAEHRRQLREAQVLIDALKEQLGKTAADLRAGHDSAAKKLRDEHAAALAAERARADADLSLADLGIKDPQIRRLAREHYDALDATARPASPADWVKTRREAAAKAKADAKATAPDPIGWLDAYEAHVSAAAGQQAEQRRRAPPNTDRGAGPRGGDGYSSDDIAAMSPAQLAALAGLPAPKQGA